ncbi:divalent-cation tolerance protein CutA [Actinokineospora globicatena]|uniref:divalent-cation tolerance protein CutA n=1 Tax=Actinokineospora globicatena TaxID=103729 RepID=UPI0020A41E19|nr:divalent-cation tolerance protein CutA [Actinokineospora globicatena]MCP2304044.1 divalent cation tolerance protein [Actinokineospora globicatena]GLW78605.1 divalent cation tolerance protein [Actinokineospora globicatena]GLW84728.1 divalent cation tolerance protein [Actinokineospora globicatena]
MTGFLQVSTTAASKDAAAKLARSAVGARLAASAQVIGPVASVFWHLGELGEGEEWQILLKTTSGRFAALRDHLVSEHEWDNPEVTATPLTEGSAAYFDWLTRTVSPDVTEG